MNQVDRLIKFYILIHIGEIISNLKNKINEEATIIVASDHGINVLKTGHIDL